MNVIIPMAGLGARFREVGYDSEKHQIQVFGKSLLEWSLLSLLRFRDCEFHFIARQVQDAGEELRRVTSLLGIGRWNLNELDAPTDGQATTALEAASTIADPTDPIVVFNVDTFVEPNWLDPTSVRGDGWVPCFLADGDHWSFVQFDSSGLVTEIEEKVRISKWATIGLYHFSSFGLFAKCYDETSLRIGERYIAPIYRTLLADSNRTVYTDIVPAGRVHVLGTPGDLKAFTAADAAPYLELDRDGLERIAASQPRAMPGWA